MKPEELEISGWKEVKWGTHRVWLGPYGHSHLIIKCFGACKHSFACQTHEFREDKETEVRMIELFKEQVPPDCGEAKKVLGVRAVLES